jgi:hypothetical protein
LAGSDLPDGVSVRDLGEQHLKDVRSERIYQLDLADAPRSFPALKADKGSTADDLGDRLAARVEAMVERELDNAFGDGRPPTRLLAGLTAFGLATLFVFLAVLVGIGFLIKVAFF